MTLRRLLLAVVALVLATPGNAAVRFVEVNASPFEGLNSRFEVTVYLDRPGEVVVLRLFEMPEGGDAREVACWRVADATSQPPDGACPSLPDGELAGGTLIVEILRSLPLARYRIEANGEDSVVHAGETFDTRMFPGKLARRLAAARRGGPPVARLDPEDIDGVSGVRRVDLEARTRGMEITIEQQATSHAGYVFDLLGAEGLVWTARRPSSQAAELTVTYDGPPLAPGDYFWLVRSTDPETILTLSELPRLRVLGSRETQEQGPAPKRLKV